MEEKLSEASRRATPSPIQQLSHLAQRVGAVNLAEGFPDFPAPAHVKATATAAIAADLNQYRHVQGICDVLAETMKRDHGLRVDPLTDFAICCGQSEAFAAAIFASSTCKLPMLFHSVCWRIGWACAVAKIAAAIRNIHVKLTDSAPAPFQEAALIALTSTPDYYESLKTDYAVRRNFILQLLKNYGLHISFEPQGSVFVFAELPKSWQISDIDFVTNLINNAGVAAVPGRGFFHTDPDDQSYHHRYVRFAFCKSDETLKAAAQKMMKPAESNGRVLHDTQSS
ncbi:hypothetical protein ACQ4PT_040236 [Festuca glaucescens]